MIWRPPRSTRTATLFPYTTLFRSLCGVWIERRDGHGGSALVLRGSTPEAHREHLKGVRRVGGPVVERGPLELGPLLVVLLPVVLEGGQPDRKSTRLNSSH